MDKTSLQIVSHIAAALFLLIFSAFTYPSSDTVFLCSFVLAFPCNTSRRDLVHKNNFMKKLNSLKYLLSVLIISMVIFACNKSNTSMSTGNPNTVSVKNMAFSPASLSVTSGTTVTWVNNDEIAHTVTADDGTFDSGSIAPGNSFTHTFSSVGTVNYHCSIHPMMKGAVTITAQ